MKLPIPMKHITPTAACRTESRLSVRLFFTILGLFLWSLPAGAATVYFDTNGAVAGSGVTTTTYSTWTTLNFWSASSAGTAATGAWSSGDDAVFAAGTDSSSINYTVDLSPGTTVVNSLVKNETGRLTISSNTLSLTSGIIDVAETSGTITITSTLTGNAGLTKTGNGLLAFGSSVATYTGDTTVNGGTLRFASNRFPDASRLILSNSATFQNFGGLNTVAGVSSASAATTVENGFGSLAATLTMKKTGGDESFVGLIRDNGAALGLVKDGTYTQHLSGDNTYTGSTTITAGTLLINGDSSAATGAVSVEAAGILGGTGTIGGATTLATGASLTPGDNSLSTLTFANGLDISAVNDAGNLIFSLGALNASDKIMSGVLTFGSGLLGFDDFAFTTETGFGNGAYTLFSSSGLSGTLDGANLTGMVGGRSSTLSLSGNDILLTVVPEPSTAGLFALGLCLMAAAARRKSYSRASRSSV